jgi:hypothetical protein
MQEVVRAISELTTKRIAIERFIASSSLESGVEFHPVI